MHCRIPHRTACALGAVLTNTASVVLAATGGGLAAVRFAAPPPPPAACLPRTTLVARTAPQPLVSQVLPYCSVTPRAAMFFFIVWYISPTSACPRARL